METKVEGDDSAHATNGTAKRELNQDFDKKVDEMIKELSCTELDLAPNKCKGCGDYLLDDNNNEFVEVGDDIYHDHCFVCDHCGEK